MPNLTITLSQGLYDVLVKDSVGRPGFTVEQFVTQAVVQLASNLREHQQRQEKIALDQAYANASPTVQAEIDALLRRTSAR